jgi:hypothetical protein
MKILKIMGLCVVAFAASTRPDFFQGDFQQFLTGMVLIALAAGGVAVARHPVPALRPHAAFASVSCQDATGTAGTRRPTRSAGLAPFDLLVGRIHILAPYRLIAAPAGCGIRLGRLITPRPCCYFQTGVCRRDQGR